MSTDASANSSPDVSAIEAYEQQAREDFNRLLTYTRKEPGLVVTVGYLMSSLAGLLHLVFFLSPFDVNVLPHLELTDFLLGAVYFPMIFVYFFGFSIVILTVFWLERLSRENVKWYRKFVLKYPDAFLGQRFSTMIAMLALMYLVVSAQFEGLFNYKEIVRGDTEKVTLRMSGSVEFLEPTSSVINDVQIVANLSKHLWVYESTSEQVMMFPHDAIVAIEFRPEEEKSEEATDEQEN